MNPFGSQVLRVCVFGALLWGQAAWAFKDPLEQPAFMAPKAAKALTLAVAARSNHVVTVGERGIVLRRHLATPEQSSNRVQGADGQYWLQARVPVSVNLTAVCFASDQRVFAVGHDGIILKSVDAGGAWVRVFDGKQANAQVLALAQSRLQALQSQPAPNNEALDDALLALEDAEAGAKFGPSRPLLDVWFKNETTGWVVGSYGQIFETNDGGQHWRLIADRLDNPDSRHYNSITGDSKGQLVVTGEAGRAYLSDDSGKTWQRMDTGYSGHLYGAKFVRGTDGKSIVYVYGFGGSLYKKMPDSPTWIKIKAPHTDSFVASDLRDNMLWLLDQKGRLFRIEENDILKPISTRVESQHITGAVRVGEDWLLSAQGGPRTLKMPR